MHIAERQQNFAYVKHSNVVTESSVFPKSIEKLSAGAELKNHINEHLILKGSLERVNKGMVELGKNLLFEFNMLNLFKVNDMRF